MKNRSLPACHRRKPAASCQRRGACGSVSDRPGVAGRSPNSRSAGRPPSLRLAGRQRHVAEYDVQIPLRHPWVREAQQLGRARLGLADEGDLQPRRARSACCFGPACGTADPPGPTDPARVPAAALPAVRAARGCATGRRSLHRARRARLKALDDQLDVVLEMRLLRGHVGDVDRGHVAHRDQPPFQLQRVHSRADGEGGCNRRFIVSCRVPAVATFQPLADACDGVSCAPVSVSASTSSGCER